MSEQPITSTQQSNLHIETTDLLYLLDLVKGELKTEINCHAVGTIQTFDPTTMTCTVQINYQKVLRKRNATSATPNSYTDIVIPYPVLIRVPILVMGGGGAYTTYPISGVITNSQGQITYSGDTCLVLFNDRDMDLWLENGTVTSPPNTGRLHDLSDAFALVGPYSASKPISNYNTQVIVQQDSTGNRLAQSGMMMAYAGATAPSGWLLCDGTSYAQSAYPLLFAVIGTTFGGSGSNFSVPNMQGQVAAGYKSGDANFGTLGAEVGEATHTLTTPEMPAHTHEVFLTEDAQTGSSQYSVGGSGPVSNNTSSTGGGGAHNNIQPSLVVNWIIKI